MARDSCGGSTASSTELDVTGCCWSGGRVDRRKHCGEIVGKLRIVVDWIVVEEVGIRVRVWPGRGGEGGQGGHGWKFLKF